MHRDRDRDGKRSPDRHSHTNPFDSAHLAAHLEVEGELSSRLFEQAIESCAGLFSEAGLEVRRVLDLGCGPGVGATLLGQAFPSALVLAVDDSTAMLERTQARARRLGLTQRVRTRKLDLDGELASLGRCDLAWAAMSIHHAADEVATLQRIRSLLERRGLVCVLERADPMILGFPDDLGRPGISHRLRGARSEWFESVRGRMPGALKAEAYPAMLSAAGLDLVLERTLVETAPASSDTATRRFIASEAQRMAQDLASFATADDLEALRAFAEQLPSLPARDWAQVTLTSSRKLLVGRTSAG